MITSNKSTERLIDEENNLLQIMPVSFEDKAKWLANVLHSIHDGIVVVDMNSVIIFANPAYTRNFGVPVDLVLGRKLSDIEPTSRVLEVLRTGQPIVDDSSYVKSVGINIMANITPIHEHNKLIGAVAVFRDLTEVQHLEKKLLEARAEIEQTKDLSARYFTELQELRNRLLEIDQLVCESREMRKVMELVLQVGKVDSTVLITGESGVGKEVMAKLIHRCSHRASGPFVVINCGAIPENLLESELFGYVPGSFTGASKQGKLGILELADKGTLFLDEIGELPLNLQVKMLRAIQERSFMRVGSLKPVEVDVRFIAATNRNLQEMMRQGTFREDLFYRLNVVPLQVPPLRHRKEDIVQLTRHFLNKFNRKYGLEKKLLPEVMRYLENYSWPGNVRELENMIERLVVSFKVEFISLKEIILAKEPALPQGESNFFQVNEMLSLREARDAVEKELISKALEVGGSARGAAKILSVDHSTIVRKAKRLKIPLAQ